MHLRKGSSLRTLGLPYAEDPSILKQLAYFLSRAGGAAPTHILFNGGAMKPQIFQDAVLQGLKNWFPASQPQVLSSVSLDLAVSRGAAYYGKARRGQGIRIGGGTARGLYLAIENQGQLSALTLLPKGSEEGSVYECPQVFWVQPNRPVEFRVLTSHVRLGDVQGTLVPFVEEEMHPLPPIKTLLRFGKGQADQKIPVCLSVHLTALGTLELALKAQQTNHSWNLEFQLRSVEGQEHAWTGLPSKQLDETVDAEFLLPAKQLLRSLYAGGEGCKPQKLMEQLEALIGSPRRTWSPSTLRSLWEELNALAPQRKKTQELEARFWNLAGFSYALVLALLLTIIA